jgi:hypothetical protein
MKTNCILWTGQISNYGYGIARLNNKPIRAHRLAYIETYGEIPKGLLVRHRCDNRACVNPEHLELGTNKDNSEDMVQRQRQAAGSKHGMHKLTERDIQYIREVYKPRDPVYGRQPLADYFGVDKTMITKIMARTNWKHV